MDNNVSIKIEKKKLHKNSGKKNYRFFYQDLNPDHSKILGIFKINLKNLKSNWGDTLLMKNKILPGFEPESIHHFNSQTNPLHSPIIQ